VRKKVNPAIVGLFVVAATILFVSFLVIFSSGTLFVHTIRFYTFFDTSLSGLDLGAPVKFKGVRIGSVEAINIVYDGDADEPCASVLLKIDADSLGVMNNGRILNKDYNDFYAEQISRGLAAKLSMESVVTGKFFVSLDYYPLDNERYFRDIDRLECQQIPSLATDLDGFLAGIDSVVKSLSQVDFGEVCTNLNVALFSFRHALDDLDTKRIGTSFAEACESFNGLIGSKNVRNFIHGADVAIGKFNAKFDGVADEILGAFSGIRTLLDDQSPFRQKVEGCLLQLERAMRSVHEFLDFLERNPNAIFAGKCL
jgi:paraquat-inducible protein B